MDQMKQGEPTSTTGGLQCFDFFPKCLSPDSLFSWPEFERFSTLMDPVNAFLQRHPFLSVQSCETSHFRVEENHLRKPEKSDFKQIGEDLQPFVKGLRLWVVAGNRDRNSVADRIGYLTFTPQVGVGGANTLADLMKKVNDYLKEKPLPGRLVSVESLQMRGISEGNFDPDSTCWKPKTSFFLSQQDFLSSFRIWYVHGKAQLETVGFADFFPALLEPGGCSSKPQFQLLPAIMRNVDTWVSQLPSNIRILNINTLTARSDKEGQRHNAYTTVQEDDEFHKYYLKFLRIAYVISPEPAAPPTYGGRHFSSKLFVPGLLVEPEMFSSGVFESQIVTRTRLDDWMKQTKANLVAVETVVYKTRTGGEGRDGFDAMYTWNEEHYNNQRKRKEPSKEQNLICYRVYLEGSVRDPPNFQWPRTIEDYHRQYGGYCVIS